MPSWSPSRRPSGSGHGAEDGGGPVSLQSRLEADAPGAADGYDREADPVALFRHLEARGRFHRDSGLGRLFHPGRLSLREDVAVNSLHVVVEGNGVAAHVDRVSPLGGRPERPTRYSLRRVVAHNVVGMAQDVASLLRGRQGDHRCELNGQWVPSEAGATPEEPELIEPEASAWSVQLEARVAGRLDEARLRDALATALGEGTFDGDPLEVVADHDDDDLHAVRGRLQARVVPVGRWPPLHAYLAHHPAGDVLMLNVNHAVADGFGALRVLRTIAGAYAGAPDPQAPLDFLAVHDVAFRPAPATASMLVRSAKRAVEWLRDVLAQPARLAVDQADDQPGYGFHLVGLSAEETRRVADAKASGTSRNVLMAALHLAMGDWNLEHGTPGRRLHVLAPVNLRPPDWTDKPVGNFSVTARVSTTRRERSGPASALKAVSSQTARNKATRTGVALLAALERSGLLPMWAKQSTVVLQPLTGNRLVDNAMLANLGWLDEAVSFGPEAGPAVELWFSTPARSPLSLCLGAVTSGGRLHLTFRYPHRLFGPDAARRFADCYLRQVRLVADSRQQPPAAAP